MTRIEENGEIINPNLIEDTNDEDANTETGLEDKKLSLTRPNQIYNE